MTIEEILKARGMKDDEVAATVAILGNNASARAAFEGILADADKRLQDATAKDAQVKEWWETKATPDINKAYSAQALAEADKARLETLVAKAKEAGFLPGDEPAAPAAKPVVADEDAGAKIIQQFFQTQDIAAKHFELTGKPLGNMAELAAESKSRGVPMTELISRKYDYPALQAAKVKAAQDAHDADVAKNAVEAFRKTQADKTGNENLRTPTRSDFANYQKDDKGNASTQNFNKAGWKDELRAKAVQLVQQQPSGAVN